MAQTIKRKKINDLPFANNIKDENALIIDNGIETNKVSVGNLTEYINSKSDNAKVQSDWNETDRKSDAFIKNKPTSLPARGGDADTVNGHTVNSDVPGNAKFTDTTYGAAGSSLGLMKSGGDLTINNGVAAVNDNSHNHTVSNISDLTATARELNVLDGITATTAELNYTDGVTGNIQNQLDAKAPLTSPTLTGTPKAPTAPAGTSTTQLATTAFTQTAVANHNTSTTAHSDIRNLISGLTTRLNALADSDDTTLDQLSEIVAYIKSNRTLIENVTTNKVNVSDIVDSLTSTATNKPLSAKQGKLLNDLISALSETVNTKIDTVNGDSHIGVTPSDTTVTLNHKDVARQNTTSASSPSHGGTFTAVKSVTSDSKGHVTAVDTETITLPANAAINDQTPTYTEAATLSKLTSGEKLSVTLGKISKAVTDLISHLADTVKHITSTERTNWNAAYTHSTSAHAPSGAEVNQNAFSNVAVGNTTIAADSKTDTLTIAAGSNITLTPDAANDKLTIAAANTVYTHPTTSGNKHIPSGGSSGQILRWSADGTAAWGADNNTTYSNFVKSGTGAKAGLVPAPSTTAGTSKYLREDGTWSTPPDTDTKYAPANIAPKAPGTAAVGVSAKYAREDHVHPAQTTVSGNAGTATKLATARTIQTNLASTTASSFDGSVNVTPGVSGILPIANGGTGATTAANALKKLGFTATAEQLNAVAPPYVKRIIRTITDVDTVHDENIFHVDGDMPVYCEMYVLTSVGYQTPCTINFTYDPYIDLLYFDVDTMGVVDPMVRHISTKKTTTNSFTQYDVALGIYDNTPRDGQFTVIIDVYAEYYGYVEELTGTMTGGKEWELIFGARYISNLEAGGFYTDNADCSNLYSQNIRAYQRITTGTGNAELYGTALGSTSTALKNQLAHGHYNNTTLAAANSITGVSDGSAFVIGNGTNTSKSNAFRVTGKGAAYAKAAYNSTGADYAEFSEWADGNPDNEDRRGYFVTYDEEKPEMIRIANAGDYILGIVSGNPCIIGNADEDWMQRYVFDEFGCIQYEEVEEEETYKGEDGKEQTRIVTIQKYKENPDYDPDREYVHRENRKEWSAIGWIGVLSVRDDGTCIPGGYCKVSDGGIATTSEKENDTYRVLERVTDNIVKVALK